MPCATSLALLNPGMGKIRLNGRGKGLRNILHGSCLKIEAVWTFRDLNSLTSSMGQEKSKFAALVASLLSVAQYQRGQGEGRSGASGLRLGVDCDWGGALSGRLRGLHRKLNGCVMTTGNWRGAMDLGLPVMGDRNDLACLVLLLGDLAGPCWFWIRTF